MKQVPASQLGWSEWAKLALHIRATQEMVVTTDDVWRQLKLAGVDSPIEPRAMGPIMRWGVKEGIIEPTPEVSRPLSPIRKNHHRPLAVFGSLVYRNPTPEWPLVTVPEAIL